MHKEHRFPIGLRTFKTALAVVLAMVVVDQFGATTTKLIFAMLGAMAVVQPTFKESVDSCISQIIGVIFGAFIGVLLLFLPIGPLTTTWLGIVIVIAGYNLLHIRYSPSLPCFILVMLCTTPGIEPISYVIGRIWDTAIGLGIGMLVNILIFPYDNSKKIQGIIRSLDKDLICFLEDMFDGDELLPKADDMAGKILDMERQLKLFSSQYLLLHRRRQMRQLDLFRTCDRKARVLLGHMEVLCHMEQPGRLSDRNRQRLASCGAMIRDQRLLDSVMEDDVVTNYHVDRILDLRRELLEVLGSKNFSK